MLWLGDKLVIRTPGTEYSLMIDRAAISRGTSRWQSAEEQRDVAADVAQAIVAGVDVFVVAEAGQYMVRVEGGVDTTNDRVPY